jgi:hypothetical protein
MAFLVPVAGAAVLTGLYNHARFGSPLDSGYDLGVERFDAPFVPGAVKLLFSPSYGLLLFWPASVLAVLGLRKQWQAERALTALVVGVFLGLICLYSSWWAFSGFGWGPRFLIPAVPLLALLTVPVISARHRAARVLTLACMLSGLAVQAVASTTNHWQQVIFGVYREIDCGDYAEKCIDDPRVAPLRVAWWRIHGAVVRARNPGRFDTYVEGSPWAPTYPWRWPETVAERQRRNTGFDFWAAPERWRLGRCYLWAPPLETGVPRSAGLVALLTIVAAGSLAIVVRELAHDR